MVHINRRIVGILALLLPIVSLAQIHVATTGSDSNVGTKEMPLLTIQHAVDVAQPGDTVWVHGGRYVISECIKIPRKQTTAERRCYLWAAGDGEVVIDGSGMAHTTAGAFKGGRCIYVHYLVNYWHFKGLTLCHAEDNGMKVEGSYNIMEQCVFHDNNDTGLQIGMFMALTQDDVPPGFPVGEPCANPDFRFCRGNKVINCDAYNNADLRTYNGVDNGGDADGFACKLYPGPGTEFYGCRAWNNSDDNWDLYMVYHPVLIDHCWAYHAGYTADGQRIGNGNGFKLGGGGSSGGAVFPRSVGVHVVKNCVSFGNYDKGFDQNYASEGMCLFNNTAWGNACNYCFPDPLVHGEYVVYNCVGFNATKINHVFRPYKKEIPQSAEKLQYNSWTLLDGCNAFMETGKNGQGRTADYSQEFISLSVSDFMAPRQADGSLPDNGFARLKKNSVMRDRGIKIEQFNGVTIKYNGDAPDLGAYEIE